MSKKIRINYVESRNKINFLKSNLSQLNEKKKIDKQKICSILNQGSGETISEVISLVDEDSYKLFYENTHVVEEILNYMEYACNRYERQEEYLVSAIKKMGRRK